MAGEYKAEEVGQVSVFQRLVPYHQAAVQHDMLFDEWRHLEYPSHINKTVEICLQQAESMSLLHDTTVQPRHSCYRGG